ncbi:hypothetical protein GW17_00042167 [Ensete ventricosum]|nr:hypothetical protein GW17_00042167 [Ensete ventricosum]
MVINFMHDVEFRSIFHAPSQKFKILAIPNVLAHGKLYEHDFMKKRDGHYICMKSSFDRFLVHHLGSSKYWPFPTYYPMGSRTSMFSRKNVTVINFAQSRVRKSSFDQFFIDHLKSSKYWPFPMY